MKASHDLSFQSGSGGACCRWAAPVSFTLILALLLTSCQQPAAPVSAREKELILFNWEDYMPQEVLDAFQAEYGVHVTLLIYETANEAYTVIGAQQLVFDVAVIDNDYLPALAEDGALAEIDHENLPNFKNISPNFRDLAFDPGNKYSIPYNFGTTGLLVRSDQVENPMMRWSDLWDPAFNGKIAAREEPVELISVALLSLGYPLNTGDPSHLQAALERLIEIKPKLIFVGAGESDGADALLVGEAQALVGWSGDAIYAQQQNPAITYILPEEGSMLWGDSFVIAAASPNKDTAELFLNFILRPEIAAQIVDMYSYPSANEMALSFVDAAIANNPVIYPSMEDIGRSAWYLPLAGDVEQLYDDIWDQFMKAGS
jgi:spermidine/putrescine transport system substrate-binding protein